MCAIMNCTKFKTLEGCSKCSYSLNNSKYIPFLDAVSIVDILDIIMKECSTNTGTIVVLDKSSIDCSGNVTIIYTNNTIQSYIKDNRYVCYKFIHAWLKYNSSEIYSAMQIMYLVLCAAILSCDEREQKALELIVNLETLFNYIQRYITILNRSGTF